MSIFSHTKGSVLELYEYDVIFIWWQCQVSTGHENSLWCRSEVVIWIRYSKSAWTYWKLSVPNPEGAPASSYCPIFLRVFQKIKNIYRVNAPTPSGEGVGVNSTVNPGSIHGQIQEVAPTLCSLPIFPKTPLKSKKTNYVRRAHYIFGATSMSKTHNPGLWPLDWVDMCVDYWLVRCMRLIDWFAGVRLSWMAVTWYWTVIEPDVCIPIYKCQLNTILPPRVIF